MAQKRTQKTTGANKARRKAAEAPTKKARRAPARRASPKAPAPLRSLVPERVEKIEAVRKTLDRLEETRGVKELNDTIERLRTTLDELAERVQELESKTREEANARALELLERLRATRAAETVAELPERVTDELDQLLDRMGLMRKARHAEELEAAKRRAKKAGERAAKKPAAKKKAPATETAS